MKKKNRNTLIAFFSIIILFSCSESDYKIEYASGYPSMLAGNWVVFEFQGGTLDGSLGGPYDMSTALAPNEGDKTMLVMDNLYNSGSRIKVDVLADTGFYADKADQLDVINMGGYGIEKISISGYINDNYILQDFIYQLAQMSFENIAFSKNQMTEIIFYRAGYYDQYNTLIDSVLVMGYRKTGFEDEVYK